MTARTPRATVARPVTLTPLLGFPEIREGDDLAFLTIKALQDNKIQLVDGDILVLSSKIASKAMGLRAPAADQAGAVLSQTVRIVAERMTASGVTRIVESAAGPVMTAAGVDASNAADTSTLLLLPDDPDAVAAQIRDGMQAAWTELTGTSRAIGVILSDTAGRPWRHGQTDFALGTAGIHVIDDLRGSADANGRNLSVTERCVADEIASAADLVKGKAANIPAAHVRGLDRHVLAGESDDQDGPPVPGARDLVRTGTQDWFGYGMVEAVRAALGVEPGSAIASEVGIPFIQSEDVATRAGRALRVALLSRPGATAEIDGATITLTAPDNFTLGVVAARAEVALHGEGLATKLAGDGLLTDLHTILIVFQ